MTQEGVSHMIAFILQQRREHLQRRLVVSRFCTRESDNVFKDAIGNLAGGDEVNTTEHHTAKLMRAPP